MEPATERENAPERDVDRSMRDQRETKHRTSDQTETELRYRNTCGRADPLQELERCGFRQVVVLWSSPPTIQEGHIILTSKIWSKLQLKAR